MRIRYYMIHARTRTGLHIGSNQGIGDVSDSMFRRDAAGRLLLPGTSIAGAIRSHLTHIIPAMSGLSETQSVCESLISNGYRSPDHILSHLMGHLDPEQEDTRASRLIVNDAVIDVQHTHIRDGVGIDRTSGTASRQGRVKFDAETVPAGAPLMVQLELEDYDDMDAYLVDLALSEWQAGRIRFGGNTSRGLGQIDLEQVEVIDYDLSSPHEMMAYLRHEPINQRILTDITPHRPETHFAQYRPVLGSVQHVVEITFQLQAQGFFLTNDATESTTRGFDHYSLSFLPGASLRGAIRSQAERIARTIANLEAYDEQDFLVRCAASDPLVMDWTPHNAGLESTVSRIRRSGLNARKKMSPDLEMFDLIERLFGTTYHGSRLQVDDAPMIGQPFWKKLDFVAINRFTGGAADQMKFDAHALWQPHFDCRLHMEAPEAWEIGCLLAVLFDIAEGRVPVGFGAAKGFGAVSLADLRVTIRYAHPEAVTGIEVPPAGDSFFTDYTVDVMNGDLLNHFIQLWQQEVLGFRVDANLPLNAKFDPYWGVPNIALLYPRDGGMS